MLRFFILLIFVIYFGKSLAVCPVSEHCQCKYNDTKQVYSFNCTDGIFFIFAKLHAKYEIQISCGVPTNTDVYDLLPKLNQSYFKTDYKIKLFSSCLLPQRFSSVTKHFPPPTQVELVWMNIKGKNISDGFFDKESSSLINHLNLNENKVKEFDESTFENLTQLKWIDVSQNIIQKFSPKLFLRNTKLSHFSLKGNLYEKPLLIPDGFLSNLKYLESVTLMNNANGIIISKDAFANASKLRELVLSSNKISQPNG